MDYEAARRNMVESRIRTGTVTHAALLDALSAPMPRERFLPPDRAFAAYVDDDVLVAPGRYLMEPMVLAPPAGAARRARAAGDRALLVGAGAGYAAAVLARLVASVTALESDPALAVLGEAGTRHPGCRECHPGGRPAGPGWPGKAPYDLILIEGAVEEVPQALFDQLANGGRIVAVVKTEGMGRATLFIERNKVISHRPAFDAAVPLLAELIAVNEASYSSSEFARQAGVYAIFSSPGSGPGLVGVRAMSNPPGRLESCRRPSPRWRKSSPPSGA